MLNALPHIRVLLIVLFAFIVSLPATLSNAVEPVNVGENSRAIDLSSSYELLLNKGAAVQVTTARDADGIVNRIEVRSETPDGSGNWLTFALANTSDRQLDRLLVAPHFRLVNSGFWQPNLGQQQLRTITPSQGFALERLASSDADIFSITLDPGQIVTFVVELVEGKPARLTLWEPDVYKDTINSFTLYEGIVLGIAGLLALFLTIIFVVRGSAMFPATAALAWSVLFYVCVDFGFISRITFIPPNDLNFWRASAELSIAAAIIVFLHAYLRLGDWKRIYTIITIIWLVLLGIVAAAAFVAPEITAGIARLSFVLSALLGLPLILILAAKKFDRAILLIPTWLLIIGWCGGAWLTVSGQLDNDIVQPALGGGLVLIVLLLSFTVLQHAFSGGTSVQNLVSDVERQALALTGAGDAVWDWNVDQDDLFAGSELHAHLGYQDTSLNGPPSRWFELLHPFDRDRFKSTLDVVLDHRRGRIAQDIRMRAQNGQYHWLSLKARPVIGNDGEVLRCVGTITDVTDERVSQERLLYNAVHDSLTGMPNRELFIDRLHSALSMAQADNALRPSVLIIDIDRFGQINSSMGISTGDSVLVTIARRIQRLLSPQDCLARINGDQFGLLILSKKEPEEVAALADAVKRSIGDAMSFAEEQLVLTASIGIVSWSQEQSSAEEMLKDAELAMFQAKRVGGDRIEPFRLALRSQKTPAFHMENELRQAIERGEIELLYQPIVDLQTGRIGGFEALMRWRHPARGLISPSDFIPIAEQSDLIVRLSLYVLDEATKALRIWQKKRKNDALFVSVNISSKQLMRQDLISDVTGVLSRNQIPASCLKLELTEALIMENPEQATHILNGIKDLGVGLLLDDFGTGYSCLSQLMRLPFDTIKINRSFVALDGTKGRPIILRSMVSMAHDISMNVVAEGTETATDAQELRGLGCQYAQGLLFGEPMLASAASSAIKQDFSAQLGQSS